VPWLPVHLPDVDFRYYSLSLMFGAALLTLWFVLVGYDLKDLSARTIATLTGYLLPRPDPALEALLRDAFDRFDRDLSSAIGDCGAMPQQPGEPS
jgi:hypothetical protein